MASSRQMRGRRLLSPTKNVAPQTRPAMKNETQAEPVAAGIIDEEWEEPARRTPVPSFEDFKGLERQGVLEHMEPLGHPPGPKLRAKMKYQEIGPRGRTAPVKNGESKSAREEAIASESAPLAPSPRRSEPRRPETLINAPKSREEEEDGDYQPPATAKIAPVRPITPVSIQPAANSSNSASRPSTEGRDKMKEVVIKAAKRANDMGTPLLGHAIQQLYEESFHSQKVADLLAAVLAQKQTPEQTTEFQLYIKAAKKAIKHGKGDLTKSAPLSNSVSQSPDKSGRTGVTRHSHTINDTNPPGLNHLPSPTIHTASSKPPMNNGLVSNGSPSKDERPAKRLKRRASAESSSSGLSSVDSRIEGLIPENVSSTLLSNFDNQLPPQRAFQTGPKTALGPRLGSFKKQRQFDSSRQSTTELIRHPVEAAADDEYVAKRRKLVEQQSFSDYIPADSRVRPLSRNLRPTQAVTPMHTPSHRTEQPQSRLRTGTLQRNKRYDDDDDTLSSPPSSPGDPLIPPPAGASRGGTPNHLHRHLKPVKKAKVKNSPLKRQKNVTAGVARLADTDSTFFGTRRGDDNHDHENSDFCAACSGGGKLLCCDGCERAFHFSCLQPPTDPDAEPDGEWMCIKCLKNRLEFPLQPRGIFRDLNTDVSLKNPSAFNLPQAVRDYFDCVKTGEEGEYEDTVSIHAKKTHGGGYEENPNNLKLRDSKDNAILCFRCGKSAMGKGGLATREIVACDFCSCSWHLDCLDPPLASAPNRKSTNGKPRHTWMCPAHADDALLHLDPSLRQPSKSAQSINPPTSRSYRVRRPKYPKIIDIALRRGFRNNGLIEIENDSSGEEDAILQGSSSGITRVPEAGIKLDFIERVNRLNAEENEANRKAKYRDVTTQTDVTPLPTSVPQSRLDHLSFTERKAALNLTQFARGLTGGALSADNVRNLIQTLTAEAPNNVEKLVTDAENASKGKKDASISIVNPLSGEEKNDLQTLMELAQRRLRGEI